MPHQVLILGETQKKAEFYKTLYGHPAEQYHCIGLDTPPAKLEGLRIKGIIFTNPGLYESNEILELTTRILETSIKMKKEKP